MDFILQHFLNWWRWRTNVDWFFKNKYNYGTKQVEVSEELAKIRIYDSKKGNTNDSGALTSPPLALSSNWSCTTRKGFWELPWAVVTTDSIVRRLETRKLAPIRYKFGIHFDPYHWTSQKRKRIPKNFPYSSQKDICLSPYHILHTISTSINDDFSNNINGPPTDEWHKRWFNYCPLRLFSSVQFRAQDLGTHQA